MKTIRHDNSKEDNSEDDEEEENGYSENDDSASENEDDDEDDSDGEYILGLPRAQPNSNRNPPLPRRLASLKRIGVMLVNVTNEEIEMLLSEVRNLGGSHFLRKYISPESKFSLHDLLYAFGYKIVNSPIYDSLEAFDPLF